MMIGRRRSRLALALLLASAGVLLGVRAPGADAPAQVAIGADVGRLTFIDIRFLPRALEDFGARKAFVLAFVVNGCPVADRYLPRLAAIEKEYRERGVQFVAVNSGSADTVIAMAASAIDHGVEFPMVKDLDGSVARAVGATRTPEVVVLAGARKLRYRGRVDSQYRIGGMNPEPGRADLREAIEDVLADRDVRVPETEVDGCLIAALAGPPAPPARAPGFAEDVAPILQRNCQECHRPGGKGPFSLVGYEDARKRAPAIAEAVELGRMPPWFADPRHGTFANCRRLSDDERRTLLDWTRSGTAPGDLARLPPPRTWPEGKWEIHDPDLELHIFNEVQIPAQGYIPYQYATLHRDSMVPFVFKQDTWVEEIQILADNPAVLHHANLFYRELSGKDPETHFVTGVVPGGVPMQLEPGTAFLFPKGSILVLQMHHVTRGREETDRLSVGIVFAKHPVKKRLHHIEVQTHQFAIPAGAPAAEVRATDLLPRDSTGVGMFVHMHLRGRDMRFVAHYPDGKEESLLLVPNYSFDWQIAYVWEKGVQRFPGGTKIECIAHYDNSTFNPFNPDPKRAVGFGQETIDEMMYGFFFYTEDGENLDLQINPRNGRVRRDEGSDEK